MAERILTRYDRQVWLLVAGSLINTFGTSIAYPFVSLYLFKYKGIPMTDVGLALLAAAAAGGIVSVAGGELCDRFGRKIMLNVGLFLQMVAFALLGYAIMANMGYTEFLLLMVLKEISGGLYLQRFKLTTSLIMGSLVYAVGFVFVGFCTGFWTLLASMFVITVGELVVTPASQTLLSQMAPPDARGRYMSFSGFIGSAGSACGPAFGGQLMDRYTANIAMMWLILGMLEVACAAGYLYLRLKLTYKMDVLEPKTAMVKH